MNRHHSLFCCQIARYHVHTSRLGLRKSRSTGQTVLPNYLLVIRVQVEAGGNLVRAMLVPNQNCCDSVPDHDGCRSPVSSNHQVTWAKTFWSLHHSFFSVAGVPFESHLRLLSSQTIYDGRHRLTFSRINYDSLLLIFCVARCYLHPTTSSSVGMICSVSPLLWLSSQRTYDPLRLTF